MEKSDTNYQIIKPIGINPEQVVFSNVEIGKNHA